MTTEEDRGQVICPECGHHFVPAGETAGDVAARRTSQRIAVADLDLQTPVDPDRVMASLQGTGVGRPLAVAAVVHVVVILITSIGYLQLCARYGSLYPKPLMAEEARQAEAAAKAEKRAESAPRETGGPAAGVEEAGGAPAAAPAPESEPAPAEGGQGESAIEQELQETSGERPGASDMSLDKVLDLE